MSGKLLATGRGVGRGASRCGASASACRHPCARPRLRHCSFGEVFAKPQLTRLTLLFRSTPEYVFRGRPGRASYHGVGGTHMGGHAGPNLRRPHAAGQGAAAARAAAGSLSFVVLYFFPRTCSWLPAACSLFNVPRAAPAPHQSAPAQLSLLSTLRNHKTQKPTQVDYAKYDADRAAALAQHGP